MTAEDILNEYKSGRISQDQADRLLNRHYAKQSKTKQSKKKNTRGKGRPENAELNAVRREVIMLYWYILQSQQKPPKKSIIKEILAEALGFDDVKTIDKWITEIKKRLDNPRVIRTVGSDGRIIIMLLDSLDWEMYQRSPQKVIKRYSRYGARWAIDFSGDKPTKREVPILTKHSWDSFNFEPINLNPQQADIARINSYRNTHIVKTYQP